MLCSLSNLSEEKLAAIKAFEEKSGKTLLAFSCQDIKTAALTADDLDGLQGLEKDLGLSLVAVEG